MLAERYAPVITGRPAFISFQTVAGLRYGALRRGWGTARMLRLDAKIQRAEVVHTGPELILVCAQLRADCERVGHALAQHEHNADRWIAATAIRLGIPTRLERCDLRGRTRPRARIGRARLRTGGVATAIDPKLRPDE